MAGRRRVLVVDDHSLFAEALATVLQGLGAVDVVVATSAEAGLAHVRNGPVFDLVLLDLGLPGLAGLDAFRALAEAAPGVPIVVVTGAEPSAESLALVRHGARGFVHKRARADELVRALRYVLDGGTHIPAELLSAPLPLGDGDVQLTPRQREVLAMLASGRSNKDISDTLGIAEATVRVHVSSVLRALGVENRTQAATSSYARRLVQR